MFYLRALFLFIVLVGTPFAFTHAKFQMGLGQALAESGTEVTDKAFGLPSCGSGPAFTVSPMAPADIRGLVPLGGVNHIFPTGHLYFYTPVSGTSTVNVPIYMPGDVWVTEAIAVNYTYIGGDQGADYSLYFQPCREITGFFLHLQTLSADLLNAIGPINGRCESYTTGTTDVVRCRKEGLKIQVTAGTPVGSAGSETSLAMDFGVIDRRTRLPFVNPSRYNQDYAQAVCPLDYASPLLQLILTPKLGSYDGTTPRTVEPLCGEIMQDIAGTAQGNWFLASDPQTVQEDNHMSLVHDNIDPSIPIFSVGTGMSRASLPVATRLTPGAYAYTPSAFGRVNRDFSDISADGHMYCFHNFTSGPAGLMLLVQMPDDTTLRIEKRTTGPCGLGPWTFTAGSTTDYIR